MKGTFWGIGLLVAAIGWANPLKSGCCRQGWIKVVSVAQPVHLRRNGLCEHPSGRIFMMQEDAPVADALWVDPIDQSYYLRDGNRRIVLQSKARVSMNGFLTPDGSLLLSFWESEPAASLPPLIWQDWEVPLIMSSDSRIVVGESGRVLWVPEFNGITATPISWSNIGWVTLRLCQWTQSVERQLLNVAPFSAAHAVLAQSVLREGELVVSPQAQQLLIQQGHCVQVPLSARTKLQTCSSIACPSRCDDQLNGSH